MKIFKSKETTVYLFDLDQFLLKHNIVEGEKFGISFKVEKKRKLRAYKVTKLFRWPCDDYGQLTELEIKKGNVVTKMESVFGPWTVTL